MSFMNGTDPSLRQIRTPTVDTYTAGAQFTAGSSTQVSLSADPGTENSVVITFDGVTQHRDTYAISGTTVTFDAAIATGVSKVEATYTTTIPANEPADASVTVAKLATSGTASASTFLNGSMAWATPSGKLLQVVNTTTSASATGTADFGNDDTIPQNTEGTEFMTLAITPAATSNKLIIITNVQYTNSASARTYFALFQDSTANALGGAIIDNSGNDIFQNMSFQHYMTAGTTSATTFKIRGGTSSGTLRVNGNSGGRFWGGILSTSMTIMEID